VFPVERAHCRIERSSPPNVQPKTSSSARSTQPFVLTNKTQERYSTSPTTTRSHRPRRNPDTRISTTTIKIMCPITRTQPQPAPKTTSTNNLAILRTQREADEWPSPQIGDKVKIWSTRTKDQQLIGPATILTNSSSAQAARPQPPSARSHSRQYYCERHSESAFGPPTPMPQPRSRLLPRMSASENRRDRSKSRLDPSIRFSTRFTMTTQFNSTQAREYRDIAVGHTVFLQIDVEAPIEYTVGTAHWTRPPGKISLVGMFYNPKRSLSRSATQTWKARHLVSLQTLEQQRTDARVNVNGEV